MNVEFPILNYTLINEFKNCPFKAYHTKIAKTIPTVQSPEMMHGNRVHEAMEQRVAKEVKLPEDLHYMEPFAQALEEYQPLCEVKMGVDANGKPVGWTGRGVWFRGRVDVLIARMDTQVAAIYDYKTGKKREGYGQELELYTSAFLAKACYPHLTQVHARFLWTKQLFDVMGKEYIITDFEMVHITIADYAVKIRTCFDSGVWPKTPNKLCDYCPVKACEHNTNTQAVPQLPAAE